VDIGIDSIAGVEVGVENNATGGSVVEVEGMGVNVGTLVAVGWRDGCAQPNKRAIMTIPKYRLVVNFVFIANLLLSAGDFAKHPRRSYKRNSNPNFFPQTSPTASSLFHRSKQYIHTVCASPVVTPKNNRSVWSNH
jgi:hypothetical protein